MSNNQTDRYIPDVLDANAEKLIDALCNDEEIAVRFGGKYEGALPNKITSAGNNLLLTITVRNRRIRILVDRNGEIIESPNDDFDKICNDINKGDNLCTAKDNQPDKHGGGLDICDTNTGIVCKKPDNLQSCCDLKLPLKVLGPGPKYFAACLCRFGTIELYVENSVDTESENCIRRFTPISIERTLDSVDNSLILKDANGQTLIYDPKTKKGSLLA